ncbi:TPA: hypothetical protein N3288_002333 [Klebsiella aerogenes]|nr:hypothetical protein [Klebsiella aerogenes]
MTDITELAQREKFEAWVMTKICISKSTLEGLRSADGYRNSTLSGTNYNRMWNCWKAAGAEMVEALEKAQQRNGELETYSKTTLEFREAARDENRHLKLELEIAEKRIAELEESHAQVIQSRDHYKRMSEEGLKQLAESRTVTVKLPKLKMLEDYLAEVAVEERKAILLGVRMEFHRALNAEGIKWEAE